MHFPWHCGLLCCCLGIFAKSMHLLQTLLYWLCIYTYMYLTFVTLHFISSWLISSPVQWSGLGDEYIVCRYMFGISTSHHSFSWFVLQSWWSVLCHDFLQFVFLGFFFINVHLYRFMILCSEKYTIAKWFLVSSTRLPCTIG